MARPDEYKNKKRGRVTTLFDISSSTGHLYEDTYVGFQEKMQTLSSGDQRGVRNLMRKSMKSDEAIEPESAEEDRLFKTAREAGININDDTQHWILKEWSKGNFSAKHQPEWMISIGGSPTLARKLDDMQEKLKGMSPDSSVPDFVRSTTCYQDHDYQSQIQLKRSGINGLNYSVARAALDA